MAFTAQEKIAIGKSVRRLRKARRWRQRDLAAAAPASPATLSKIENGNVADDPYVLQRIAQALDVTVDDLLRGGPDPSEPERYSPEWFVAEYAWAHTLGDERERDHAIQLLDDLKRSAERFADFTGQV